MTIETIANIDDKVWFMYQNKINTGTVVRIKLVIKHPSGLTPVNEKSIIVHQNFDIHTEDGITEDNTGIAKGVYKVYKSKEELINSL